MLAETGELVAASRGLDGKTFVVTGASRGIGRAIANALLASGANVVAVARGEAALASIVEAPDSPSERFLSLPHDVADPESVFDAAAAAWEWKGHVDGVVNVAGTNPRLSVADLDRTSWLTTLEVNLLGAFWWSRAVASRLIDAGSQGSVVNIASISGVVSDGGGVAYSASKAALINMTTVLAELWSPLVRVNAVSPGWVLTEMTADYLSDESNLQLVRQSTPLGRVATEHEISAPALFLLSSDSAYLTGHNLIVDGGWTTR